MSVGTWLIAKPGNVGLQSNIIASYGSACSLRNVCANRSETVSSGCAAKSTAANVAPLPVLAPIKRSSLVVAGSQFLP